jgi:hypothetical protein
MCPVISSVAEHNQIVVVSTPVYGGMDARVNATLTCSARHHTLMQRGAGAAFVCLKAQVGALAEGRGRETLLDLIMSGVC